MIFNYFKKLNKEINEEWESMEPMRLHKEAFEFLQKEFDAWPFLSFNSAKKDLKKTEAICQEGGNIYDICWSWYFRLEIFFCCYGETIDSRKMLIYNCCKHYYENKKFSLAKTYEEVETNIKEFEKNIPPEFPFYKLEVTPKNKEVKERNSTILNNDQLEKNRQGKIIQKNLQKRTYADGSIYEGEFNNNDEPYGQGTLTYADGSIYEGEFKNNKPNGIGTYTDAEGNILSGQFKNGDFISKLK